MTRFKKIPQVNEGKIIYDDGIVDGIVLLAVNDIPFIELDAKDSTSQMRSSAIKVRSDKDGIHVDVYVKIHFTQNVSETAFKIQEEVRHNIETMTEYRVASVNVHISGVSFEEKEEKIEEDKNASSEKQQDGNVWELTLENVFLNIYLHGSSIRVMKGFLLFYAKS